MQMASFRSDASSSLSSQPKTTSHFSRQHSPPSPSSPSTSAIPSTPQSRRCPSHLHHLKSATPQRSTSLLTPVSSKASLSPAPLTLITSQPASPAFSPRSANRQRRFHSRNYSASFCLPRSSAQPTLSVQLEPVFSPSMAAFSSLSVSHQAPPRPISPAHIEHIPRPPSRCEYLLRDTLRRADEYERTQRTTARSGSRSPVRWPASRPARPRGNSILGALSRNEDIDDSDSDGDDDLDPGYPTPRESFNYLFRASTQSAPRAVRGNTDGSLPEAMYRHPYGSPSSPSPMPPSMLRTRTSPAVPRASHMDDDRNGRSLTTRSTQGRLALPYTAMGGGGPSGHQSYSQSVASNESSPKQRLHNLSPHESVLRAKLEYVLQRAGPVTMDEKSEYVPQAIGRVRNHHRSQSHGVTIMTSQKHHDDATASVSSRSFKAGALSNSTSDISKIDSSATSYRKSSIPHKAGASSPSSPSEPLTPPPTPPFNAQTASEMCKRMSGYVSFANVEGLGEPPGMDIDSDEGEENAKRWGRWWRMWSFINGVHSDGSQGVESRDRSDSSSSR